jgi:hypothetical protein
MSNITNFPKNGDNQEISLRNSNFSQFDYDFALNIKENYSDIWAKGGNIRGNEAFEYWGKARNGEKTQGVLDWIKEREAWMARHEKDKLIAGVVAVMKWGGIITRGEKYMKDLINDEKDGDKSMNKINKVLNFEVKQVGKELDRTLRFSGSDETEDRDGDILTIAGWELDEYNKNPVIMGFHEYDKFPYARSLNTQIDLGKQKLIFDVQFPTINELTSYPENPDMLAEHAKNIDMAYNMYRNGYMKAVSVGFIGKEYEPITKEGRTTGRKYIRQSLLELSLVPVPSNPNALSEAKIKGIIDDKQMNEIIEKTVIPYKSYPTEPDTTTWDGPAEITAASVDDLKIMCTWYDSENAENKGAYKLPHHRKSDYHLIWRGVTAVMGVLLGARGGVDIPEEDKQRCYNHIAKHYKDDFDKEPPEFKAYTKVELKEMFPEDKKQNKLMEQIETKKPDIEGNPSVWDIMHAVHMAINPADICQPGGPWIEDLYPVNYPSGHVILEKQNKYYLYQYTYENGVATLSTEYTELEEIYSPKSYKTGATLSGKNKEMLNEICNNIKACGDRLRKFIDSSGMMEDDTTMMEDRKTGINELKQALEEIKSQVLLLSQKSVQEGNALENKEIIDLDTLKWPKSEENTALNELNFEPEQLLNAIEKMIEKKIN